MSPPMRSPERARRRYRLLLRCYPADYYRNYAEPVLQLFDDLMRDAPPALQQRVIRAAFLDTTTSIVREQIFALKHKLFSKETFMSKPKPSFIGRHRLAVGIIAGIVVITAAFTGHSAVDAATSAIRVSQINSDYTSLHLDNSYLLTSTNVFGDKRMYSYDGGRTMASSNVYSHDASVDATVAQLRPKIEAAGFAYFEEPYPGSAQTELHFKSKDGHYLRLTVSSTHRDEVASSGDANLLSTYDQTHSPNEGPSTVTIKINLDDNNE